MFALYPPTMIDNHDDEIESQESFEQGIFDFQPIAVTLPRGHVPVGQFPKFRHHTGLSSRDVLQGDTVLDGHLVQFDGQHDCSRTFFARLLQAWIHVGE